MKKADLVTQLLHKLPDLHKSPKNKVSDDDLRATKRALLFPVGNDTSIIDIYNDHYGWLDQIDKDFYKVFKPTNNQTWGATFLVSLVVVLVRNIWVMYEEYLLLRKHITHDHWKTKWLKKTHNRFILFIGVICEQIGEL